MSNHLAHYHEAHPLPFRITHWVNLIGMVFLILTGFVIHFPFLAGIMGVCRGIHVFCGIVITINLIARIIMAFTVDSAPAGGTRQVTKDYHNWLPQKDNKGQGLQWIKYYLFLRPTHPLSAKYGVPQKIAYLITPWLILFMAYTGFGLWGTTCDWPLFRSAAVVFGGLMNLRMWHYMGMWVMIIFILIHGYLASIDGIAPIMLMFFNKETGGLTYDPETMNIVDEDLLDAVTAREGVLMVDGETIGFM